jgi:hypothetical protein
MPEERVLTHFSTTLGDHISGHLAGVDRKSLLESATHDDIKPL